MPKFLTIGYGGRTGYDRTDAQVRDAAHGGDDGGGRGHGLRHAVRRGPGGGRGVAVRAVAASEAWGRLRSRHACRAVTGG